jgi:hypothetical protein
MLKMLRKVSRLAMALELTEWFMDVPFCLTVLIDKTLFSRSTEHLSPCDEIDPQGTQPTVAYKHTPRTGFGVGIIVSLWARRQASRPG